LSGDDQQSKKKQQRTREEIYRELEFDHSGVNASSILEGVLHESLRGTNPRKDREDAARAMTSRGRDDDQASRIKQMKENLYPIDSTEGRSLPVPPIHLSPSRSTNPKRHGHSMSMSGTAPMHLKDRMAPNKPIQDPISAPTHASLNSQKFGSIQMPKNLKLTPEQLSFLSNVQNSVEIISQLKSKIENLRVEFEAVEEENKLLKAKNQKLTSDISSKESSFVLFKKQATKVLEERNQLVQEMALLRVQSPENQLKVQKLEQTVTELAAKNKKLLIDQHVLQEIIKEMVFEKEQLANSVNVSFQPESTLEAYLGRTNPGVISQRDHLPQEIYHSFGDVCLGSN